MLQAQICRPQRSTTSTQAGSSWPCMKRMSCREGGVQDGRRAEHRSEDARPGQRRLRSLPRLATPPMLSTVPMAASLLTTQAACRLQATLSPLGMHVAAAAACGMQVAGINTDQQLTHCSAWSSAKSGMASFSMPSLPTSVSSSEQMMASSATAA